MKAPSYFILAASFVISAISSTGSVKTWRNGGNGLYPEAKPALDWSDASVVRWETKLDARSNASPIVVGGKVFVTAEPATLVCLDAESGELLWQKSNDYIDLAEMSPEAREAAAAAAAGAEEVTAKIKPLERDLYRAERRLRRKGEDPELQAQVDELKKQIDELKQAAGGEVARFEKPKAHKTNGYASYTPVSDGTHVWASFGLGVVVCYDLEGERVWHRRLENPDHSWGGASSPTLVDGKVIVRFTDYHALDPKTGETLWTAPTEGIVFNAPANFEVEGKPYLVTGRGELIRVADGAKPWSAAYQNDSKPWSFMNTPSVIGNRIYFAHGSEGQQGDAYCLEIPATVAELEKDGLKQVWYTEVAKNRYYSSPLVVDGVVHLISRDYVLQALDAASGELLYEEKVKGLTGTAYPSLTLAGEVLIVGAEDGRLAFLKPGRSFEEIARSEVSPFRSSPVFTEGVGYLRTQASVLALKAQ